MLSSLSSKHSISPLTFPISKSYILSLISLLSPNSLTCSLSFYQKNNFLRFYMLEWKKHIICFLSPTEFWWQWIEFTNASISSFCGEEQEDFKKREWKIEIKFFLPLWRTWYSSLTRPSRNLTRLYRNRQKIDKNTGLSQSTHNFMTRHQSVGRCVKNVVSYQK